MSISDARIYCLNIEKVLEASCVMALEMTEWILAVAIYVR
jgi:hypothetical protein